MEEKNIYIIWKTQEDKNIANVNDVIGLFRGSYEEADTLIEKLNANDPTVINNCLYGRPLYGYWRSEPYWITSENFKEFIPY